MRYLQIIVVDQRRRTDRAQTSDGISSIITATQVVRCRAAIAGEAIAQRSARVRRVRSMGYAAFGAGFGMPPMDKPRRLSRRIERRARVIAMSGGGKDQWPTELARIRVSWSQIRSD